MGAGSRSRIKATVRGEWNRRRAPKRRWWNLPAFAPIPAFAPRWAAAAATLAVALMLGGSGTVLASGYSIPGNALYPVKQVREEVQLWLTWSPEAKVDMYTRLVTKRADEIRTLAAVDRGRLELRGIGAEPWNDRQASNLRDRRAVGGLHNPARCSTGAPPQARESLVRALDAISDARDREGRRKKQWGCRYPGD